MRAGMGAGMELAIGIIRPIYLACALARKVARFLVKSSRPNISIFNKLDLILTRPSPLF